MIVPENTLAGYQPNRWLTFEERDGCCRTDSA